MRNVNQLRLHSISGSSAYGDFLLHTSLNEFAHALVVSTGTGAAGFLPRGLDRARYFTPGQKAGRLFNKTIVCSAYVIPLAQARRVWGGLRVHRRRYRDTRRLPSRRSRLKSARRSVGSADRSIFSPQRTQLNHAQASAW